MTVSGSQSDSTPSLVGNLSDDQRDRLSSVLDRYLRALEQGLPLSREDLLAEHADLAAPLRVYLDRIDELHDVAAGFVAAGGSETQRDETSDASMLREERRLGDFLIGEEIGRGGMGVVYEAHQISLARPVALKVLPFAAVLDAQQITRFKHEAQIAAQLQHPNIVPVYAIGHERGVHYYAMRLIDGQPMNQAIAELRGRQSGHRAVTAVAGAANAADHYFEQPVERRFPTPLTRGTGRSPEYFREVARIGIQAAEALHAAHESGVLHRDIKPSNLLLDRHGKLWVTDFGLARIQSDASLTRTGDVVGTAQYMSPEQAAGQSALVDQRADVYSVGATLYELLALRPPFPGANETGGRRRVDDEPTPLRKLNAHVPAELAIVVSKAMAPHREDRYHTARDLAEDLERFLTGVPIQARPPGWPHRFRRWAVRHRSLTRLAMSLGLALLIVLVASAMSVLREKAKAERNLARAQHHFRQAQASVDQFGWRLADQLREIPAAAEIRAGLLRDTLDYYRTFARDAAEDPASRFELAITHTKMAALLEQLGANAEALAAYREAVVELEQLAGADAEPYQQLELAKCHSQYGQALTRAGQLDAARPQFQRALETLERLAARPRRDVAAELERTRVQANLGHLELQANRLAAAEGALQAARAGLEQRMRMEPETAERHRELSATLNHLADAVAASQPTQAVTWLEEALKHDRAATELAPTDGRYRASLAQTYNNLGALQTRQADPGQALLSYRQAVALLETLVSQDPLRRSFRQDLAVALNNLGLAQQRQRESVAAVESFQRALELERDLLAADPRHPEGNSTLGGTYNNLGITYEQVGRLPESLEAFQRAVEFQKKAYEMAPSVSRYRDFLSRHYYNQSRVLRGLGRATDAREVAMVRRRLWSGDPDHLLGVAEELVALAETPGSADSPAWKQESWSAVVETLQQAVAAGLPRDQVQRNPSFRFLADNPDFRALVGKVDSPDIR